MRLVRASAQGRAETSPDHRPKPVGHDLIAAYTIPPGVPKTAPQHSRSNVPPAVISPHRFPFWVTRAWHDEPVVTAAMHVATSLYTLLPPVLHCRRASPERRTSEPDLTTQALQSVRTTSSGRRIRTEVAAGRVGRITFVGGRSAGSGNGPTTSADRYSRERSHVYRTLHRTALAG